MQHIVVTVVMICIGAVSGGHRCGNTQVCGPTQCGPLERPVHGSPRRDRFCRPLFTPPWELWKLRSCVCKRRYLRNSWGECIPRLKCIPCKFKWQRDYRTCAPGCPATCHETFQTSCNVPCTDGCVCPPGWVVHPKYPRKCVKAHKCLPRCPPHSSYQACVSTCLPKCGQTPPMKCHVNCERGACICKKGYLEYDKNGEKTCVLQAVCPWNNRTTHVFKPNAAEQIGTMEASGTSRTFSNETESVLREPEHAGHSSAIAMVSTNVTSTHLQSTSSENSGHGTVTSSEGRESISSSGGRINSAALDTRLGNPIDTERYVHDGTSRSTEVGVVTDSSGLEKATAGVPSNSAIRSSPARVVGSIMASLHTGSSSNPRPTVTRTSSGVREATIGVPSGGLLNSGTTGIPAIPPIDTGSAGANTRFSISGNTGLTAASGFSEVGEAASRAPSSNTMHKNSASTTSRVEELAAGNILIGNLRNDMVAGTANPSRVAEATLRATSTGTVPPSLTRTTGLLSQPQEVRTHLSGTTSTSTTGTSVGSSRSVNQPRGVRHRPGSASEPIHADATIGVTTGVGATPAVIPTGNTTAHVIESAGSFIGVGSTGGTGEAGESIGATHSISNRENMHVNNPRNAANSGGTGFSGLHVGTVGLPSDSARHGGLAHIGSITVVPRPISDAHTSGRIALLSANREAKSNSSAAFSGSVGSAISSSTLRAVWVPSQTDLDSSNHHTEGNVNYAETPSAFGGTMRGNILPGSSVTPARYVGTGVTDGATRHLTAPTGIAVNRPEVTVSVVRSPSSVTLTGSSTIVPHISAQHNRRSLGVLPGASIGSDTAAGFGTILSGSGSRNIHSTVSTTPLVYGTSINTTDWSGNTPTRVFLSTAGETSLGTNMHQVRPPRVTIFHPGTTPSTTVNLSRGRGATPEGLPMGATGAILPPENEGTASASLVTTASGIYVQSGAARGVVPVRSSSTREQLPPGAVSGESSVLTVTTSAPGPTGAMPTSGSLTGVSVNAGESPTVSNTRPTPTTDTASSVPFLTETIAGAPTEAPRSTSGSSSSPANVDRVPTVPSETLELENIVALLSHPSSSTTPYLSEFTNTREATHQYDSVPSDSMPVGAETIIRALGD